MAGICYHEKYQYRMKKILRSAAAAAERRRFHSAKISPLDYF